MNALRAGGRAAEGGASAQRALVKPRERSHNGERPIFCTAPAKGVRWLFPDGSMAPVRCGAPNRCAYCAMLTALENALVIRLDAIDGASWPNMTITTTTARPWTEVSSAEFRRAERSLLVYLRRRFGREVEWCGFVEFTTGQRARDGKRRMHEHHLVKGLPSLRPCQRCYVCQDRRRRSIDLEPCKLGQLTNDVRSKWKRYTGDAWRVDVTPLRTPLGAVAYFALHHHKLEQAPPRGWRGKRFRPTQGYFNRRIPELRAEARALISDRRIEQALVDYFDPPDYFDEHLLDELILERYEWAREEAQAERPRLVTTEELREAGVRPSGRHTQHEPQRLVDRLRLLDPRPGGSA